MTEQSSTKQLITNAKAYHEEISVVPHCQATAMHVEEILHKEAAANDMPARFVCLLKASSTLTCYVRANSSTEHVVKGRSK